MFELTIEDIVKIDGFAETMASLFVKFMSEKKNEINSLRKHFKIVENKISSGQKICFTGTAPIGRKELTALLISKGYDVKDSITKDLDILLCEDINGNSSKLVKARKLDIKIMSYDDFIKIN